MVTGRGDARKGQSLNALIEGGVREEKRTVATLSSWREEKDTNVGYWKGMKKKKEIGEKNRKRDLSRKKEERNHKSLGEKERRKEFRGESLKRGES